MLTGDCATQFGPSVKFLISQQVGRMKQDIDVMDQNFAAMSPTAQGIYGMSAVPHLAR